MKVSCTPFTVLCLLVATFNYRAEASGVHDEEELHDEDQHECTVTSEVLSEVLSDGEFSADWNVTEGCGSFAEQLLLKLNLTTPCCLENGTNCSMETVPTVIPQCICGRASPSATQAYGYGFLMVILVSLASLLGLFLLPVARNKRLKQYYQYVYALLISLGASALFCDAILHLIPEAFGLHGHEEDGHAEEEDEAGELLVIWRSCVVIVGMYAFFLFEFFLHSITSHSHSLPDSDTTELLSMDGAEEGTQDTPITVENGTREEESKAECPQDCNQDVDVIFPHDQCRAKDSRHHSSILHPDADENVVKEQQQTTPKYSGVHIRLYHFFKNIKPLAWLIVFGDAVHNFADGLALGAAISQSLSLGISTTIALVFHEVPHELGDFFILLDTGMSWYAALGFNFVSALTAVIGFFVGVAIGVASEEANSWILALAAGVFLYISLVDLLPQLIHTKTKGWGRGISFIMINVGFTLSFVALLLLAIYEEDLNSLVTV